MLNQWVTIHGRSWMILQPSVIDWSMGIMMSKMELPWYYWHRSIHQNRRIHDCRRSFSEQKSYVDLSMRVRWNGMPKRWDICTDSRVGNRPWTTTVTTGEEDCCDQGVWRAVGERSQVLRLEQGVFALCSKFLVDSDESSDIITQLTQIRSDNSTLTLGLKMVSDSVSTQIQINF